MNLYKDKNCWILLKDPWVTRAMKGFVYRAFKSVESFPADIIIISWKQRGKVIETEWIYLENHNYLEAEVE